MQFKNLCNVLRGFTLAELVLAMAIVGILTAAMVPMLKYHKQRPRENYAPHGIIECYYVQSGDNWKLVQFQKDNDKHPKGDYTEINGNSCSFPVPIANYYELHTINAGTPGFGYSDGQIEDILSIDNLYIEKDGEDVKTEAITVDSNFKGNLQKNLQEHVLKLWQNSKKTIPSQFTAKTYQGSGDYDISVEIDPKVNQETGKITPDYKNVHYGSGTVGYEYTKTYNLSHDTKIEVNSVENATTKKTAVLAINGTTLLYVKGDRRPTGGIHNGNGLECDGGPNSSNCGNHIELLNQDGSRIGSSRKPSGNAQKQSSYSSETVPDKLYFYYPKVNLNYAYGTPGQNGTYSVRYFEKIRAERLILQPAKNHEENSIVKLEHPNTSSGQTAQSETLFIIKNTTTEPSIATAKYENITAADLPEPQEFNKNLVTPSPQKDVYGSFCALENKNKHGMCYRIVSSNNKGVPGQAGYGGYPLLRNLTTKSGGGINFDLKYTNNRYTTPQSLLNENNYKMNRNSTDEPSCIEGTSYKKYTNNDMCKGSEGNPGAIVLIW